MKPSNCQQQHVLTLSRHAPTSGTVSASNMTVKIVSWGSTPSTTNPVDNRERECGQQKRDFKPYINPPASTAIPSLPVQQASKSQDSLPPQSPLLSATNHLNVTTHLQQTNRQTDRQPGRETDGQAVRQAHPHSIVSAKKRNENVPGPPMPVSQHNL